MTACYRGSGSALGSVLFLVWVCQRAVVFLILRHFAADQWEIFSPKQGATPQRNADCLKQVCIKNPPMLHTLALCS